LVPFDFSKPAETALRYATTFAGQFNADVTLLYVIEPTTFSDFESNPLVLDNDAAVEKAKQRLESVRLTLGEYGRQIRNIKVLIGKPFHAITNLAKWQKIDLIIISTHGRTALKHVLLGSTAEKVVRHAGCPVLVVR
jgi:nucleotide-binding universal stress UspA family protein